MVCNRRTRIRNTQIVYVQDSFAKRLKCQVNSLSKIKRFKTIRFSFIRKVPFCKSVDFQMSLNIPVILPANVSINKYKTERSLSLIILKRIFL